MRAFACVCMCALERQREYKNINLIFAINKELGMKTDEGDFEELKVAVHQ